MANEINLTTNYANKKTDCVNKAPSYTALFRKKKPFKKKKAK